MIEHRDVRMEFLCSKEVAEIRKRNDMVILPVGCFEHHAPRLPLGCDTFIDWGASIILAETWDCLVLPPVFFVYPGASGPWPGSVEISPEMTQAYVKEIVLALHKNGFGRVVLAGSHGPLGFMLRSVVRAIYRETEAVVLFVQPYELLFPDDLMEAELGYKRGEDIAALAGLRLLGWQGAYDPRLDVDKPGETPSPTLEKLASYGAVPWLYNADFQHGGMRTGIDFENADKAIAVMRRAAKRLADVPELFRTYQEELEKLVQEAPWDRDEVWSI